MSDNSWIDRLKEEHTALNAKCVKLGIFMKSPKFHELPYEDKALLQAQQFHMGNYARILERRIRRAEPDNIEK